MVLRHWLLKQELRSAGDFFLCGHMLYVNGKYLSDWKVKQANKWLKDGKIIPSRIEKITSTSTGRTYTNQLFKFKI